ncbi:metallophosphoesterase [Devosia sp. SL43]|uniref:metallophosphoesterase n=1 Tax=Devosia sp. SL43 TaxID=2806348 RepID=UPI001F41DC38|nr:metallophosphoesterase [Devosia sp. SL43]UJW87346.1 metallophosphoesterase [Devosia sp. SL43]
MRLRIAVLTDFHACTPFMDAARLRAICAEANALNPDIILLLGDYAAGPRFSRDLRPKEWAAELSTLQAPLGVHAVLGNHDYDGYRRADLPAGRITTAEAALQGVGIPVYTNQAQRIATPGGAFWLAGLGDQFAFEPRHSDHGRGLGVDDLDGTLAQIDGDEPIILMAHEPDLFPDTPDRVALTLSGHTHAGQVRLFGQTPVVPSRHGSRYVHGHYVEGQRHLIVSAGLGYSGWPIRLGTRPEIVLVELGGTT